MKRSKAPGRLEPHWGSLQHSPRTPSWWEGEHPLPKNPSPLGPSSFALQPFGPNHFHGPPHNVADGLAPMYTALNRTHVIAASRHSEMGNRHGVVTGE